MPSSHRPGTGSPAPRSSDTMRSKEPPEILHQLGRIVLAYSLKKLSEQKTQSQHRSKSAPRRSSHSKTGTNRDPSRTSNRASSRDVTRSDSGDMHTLASQLAVGVLAFGIRHLIRRRREAKHKAADAAAATQAAGATRAMGSSQNQGQAGGVNNAIDPELSTALDSVTKELQGATESIRRLAFSVPAASHRDCPVREALVKDAERLSGSLANMQASVHNMRNLHPGLEAREERRRRERERRRERDRESGEGERKREKNRTRAVDRDMGRGRDRLREKAEEIRARGRREGRAEEVTVKGKAEEWVERVRSRGESRTEDLGRGERDRRRREYGRADDGRGRSVERLRRCLGKPDEDLQRGRRPERSTES